MTKKLKDMMPAAPHGEKHALPLRQARTRVPMPLTHVLARVAEPSPALEEVGIAPAALEAGLKIRLARTERGLTQSQLARMAKISQPALSNIEQGKGSDGPSYGTLREITKALGIELFPEPELADGVELSLITPEVVATEAVDESIAIPKARSFEVSNAYGLMNALVDNRLQIKIRDFLQQRKAHYGGGKPKLAAQMYSLDAKGIVHIDVIPKTALMVHGAAGFISARGGSDIGLEFVHGTARQVAMVDQSGCFEMQNHRSEPVLVFAIPTQTLLKE